MYFVTLVATNLGGQEMAGPTALTTEGVAPTLTEVASSDETATSAKLSADVNPNGSQLTKCTFEYGLSTSYESTASCEQPLPSLSGRTLVPLSVTITSLEDNHEYHWRLTAESAAGIETSVDHTFIYAPADGAQASCAELKEPFRKEQEQVREERHSTTLPDCRAYEMVTPPEKNGALIDALFAGGGTWRR
jgi:hypothetical protein